MKDETKRSFKINFIQFFFKFHDNYMEEKKFHSKIKITKTGHEKKRTEFSKLKNKLFKSFFIHIFFIFIVFNFRKNFVRVQFW